MSSDKVKHLEFLQSTISRMSTAGFLVKGWSITLVSALFALSVKNSNHQYVIIAYVIIPIFWFLDGFFLSRERRFRDLYDSVRKAQESEIDFSMDSSSFSSGGGNWANALISRTLLLFYGASVLAILIVMFLLGQ